MNKNIRILANISLSALLIALTCWVPGAIGSDSDSVNVVIQPNGISASAAVGNSSSMEIRVAGPAGLVDTQTSDNGVLEWFAPNGLADGQYRYDIYIAIESGAEEDNDDGTTLLRKHGEFEVEGGSLREPRTDDDLSAIEKTDVPLLSRALEGLFDFILPSAAAADLISSNLYGGRVQLDESDQGDAQDWYVEGSVTSGFHIRDDVNDATHNNASVFNIIHSLNNTNSFVVDTNGDISLADGSFFIDKSSDNVGIGTTSPSYDLHLMGGNLFLDTAFTNGDWRFQPGSTGLWFRNQNQTTTNTIPVKFNNQAPTDSLVVEGGTGEIGLGTATPERQLHLKGANAVFRMDRSTDTAAFMLVRTTAEGAPLKNFVVGANASGSNNGEFIINDLGTGTGGAGLRRMTITNDGNAIFTGTVQATNFISSSSRRFKENVKPLSDALAVTKQLEGVRFTWKENGKPALGLIAEDVARVLPEVVERNDKDGQFVGVNYPALVAVLVEAVKEQQQGMEAQQAEMTTYRANVARQLEEQRAEISSYRSEVARQHAKITSLEAQMASFKTAAARLDEIENLVSGMRKPTLLTQR